MSEKNQDSLQQQGEDHRSQFGLHIYFKTLHYLLQMRTKVLMTGIRVRRVKLSFDIRVKYSSREERKIYGYLNTLGQLAFILNSGDRAPSLVVNTTLNSHYNCDEWYTGGAWALRE